MALSVANAEALGAAIAAALTAPGAPTSAVARWQEVCRQVYVALAADAVVDAGAACSVDPVTHIGTVTGTGQIS